MDDFFPITDD